MKDEDKTKEQLMNELKQLRQRAAELGKSETERKKAEEALRESEERFRLAFENANIGMCLVDLDGRLTKVNRQMCKIFGYNQEELESMTVNDIAHPEDSSISPQFIQRSLSGETEYIQFEKRYFHKQGHMVCGQVSSSLVRDPQGAPVYFISHVQDITERKRVEEALLESEEKFRNLAEQSPNMIFINKKGSMVYVNEKGEEITGYTREQLCSADFDFLALIAPESQQLVKASFSKHMKGKEVAPYEHTLITKEGKRFEVLVITKLISYEGEMAILGTSTDISERKHMEEALRKSEQELRVVADNLPGLLSYVDADGCYRFINKRYQDWFGLDRTDIIGKHYRRVVGETTYELIKDYVAAVLSGRRVSYEHALPYMHGGTRWVAAEYVPDVDDHGEVKGFFALIMDITERKQVEEALRKRETELELQAIKLEEANTALRFLLKQREDDRAELEEKILSNVKQLVVPCIERLKTSRLDAKQMTYVGIIESHIDDVISPFAHKLSSAYYNLTFKEIQVASLVREGKTNKEIAELLNISTRTAGFHRESLRKKLGLRNKKINLRSHLLSLQ